MNPLLNVALYCIAGGWYVHPLKPRGKVPVTKHGKNGATLDEAQSCVSGGLAILTASERRKGYISPPMCTSNVRYDHKNKVAT